MHGCMHTQTSFILLIKVLVYLLYTSLVILAIFYLLECIYMHSNRMIQRETDKPFINLHLFCATRWRNVWISNWICLHMPELTKWQKSSPGHFDLQSTREVQREWPFLSTKEIVFVAIGETVEKLTPQIGEKHSPKDMQLEDVTSSGRCTKLYTFIWNWQI